MDMPDDCKLVPFPVDEDWFDIAERYVASAESVEASLARSKQAMRALRGALRGAGMRVEPGPDINFPAGE